MKTKTINTIQTSIVRVAIVVGGILFIPLIMTLHDGGMEGNGWHWTASDFIAMGSLLGIFGLLIELVRFRVSNKNLRIFLIIGLIVLLLWLWAELAVGLFTNWG